ncbi:MAG: site-specific integrase [Nitrosopumilaceae archaeon]
MRSSRSLQSYLSVKLALRSESVRKSSKFALDNFSIFLKDFHQTTPDKIISDFTDHELALDILQAFVNWYSQTKTQHGSKPNSRTVIQVFHNVKRYLHYMGVKFHVEDIKQEIVLPNVLEKSKHGVTREEIIKILENVTFRKKALYLAQLSSGMRIGELCQLRRKHLDLTTKRIKVKIPAEFTKAGRERITFFSKEFEDLYKFKISKMDDGELVFVTNPRARGAVDNEIQNMDYVCKKVGLKDITTHSFRAYFITKVARLDYNLSKLFTGQRGYLLQYDRLNEEEKLEKYIEFESELLVFEQKPESKVTQDLKDELQRMTQKIASRDKKIEHDHMIVQVMAKTMKDLGINLEYPDGTPYEIDEDFKIPAEYLPEPEAYDKSLIEHTN